MDEWMENNFKRIARGQHTKMFEKSLSLANEINNIPERILFLHKEIKEFKQSRSDFNLVGGYGDKIKAEIEYLELANLNQNKPVEVVEKPTFTPEISLLKEWILPDYLTKFTEIESTLFDRGFIDICYKWKKNKIDLADFICVITNYKYFKPIVKGKKIQDFHKRQFISERYGIGKTGLSETWKKNKHKIDLAVIPFSWIEKPK